MQQNRMCLSMGCGVVGIVMLASVLCGQETTAPEMPEWRAARHEPAVFVPEAIEPEVATPAPSTPAPAVAAPAASADAELSPGIAESFPADAAPLATAPSAVTSPASVSAVTVSVPVMSKDTEEHWWISEAVSQVQKGSPAFMGVRLANAPRAALVETPKKLYDAGNTLAMRLWGCNDLSQEFKGRVRTVVKRGNETLQTWEETVRLAPAKAERIAQYNFDTSDLATGKYVLETSLLDDSGRLMQQQVTPITVSVSQDMEARRKARAEAKAKQEAERKAKDEIKTKRQVKGN